MVADDRTIRLADHFLGDQGKCTVCLSATDPVLYLGAYQVAECLKQGGHYTTLDMSGNALTAASAKILFEALIASDVSSVNLEWNSVGWCDSTMEKLANVLEVNVSITSLDLRNNHIGPAGAKSLARALKHSNSSLQVLDLRWNDIGVI